MTLVTGLEGIIVLKQIGESCGRACKGAWNGNETLRSFQEITQQV